MRSMVIVEPFRGSSKVSMAVGCMSNIRHYRRSIVIVKPLRGSSKVSIALG
jgi:hypothetical protein